VSTQQQQQQQMPPDAVNYASRPGGARHPSGPSENRGGGGAPGPRGRAGIVTTLVLALLLSAVLQQVAFSYRSAAINRNRPEGSPAPSRLANLDSFSLALLLGGLRGPLVMFLWTNSESQKSEKDLESFDTQVELIRLLQPEFDTVHLFQMWNKAYNISAQLASLSNKYAAILDAIEYGQRTDRANPNDINIVTSIGGLYADKLGNSSEKEYYRRRVRTETLPVYKVTFPASRLTEFKQAVKDAGLDETRVRVTTQGGDKSTAILEKLGGDRVLDTFKGTDVTAAAVPRQDLRPESRGGRRTEMDTLLDSRGMVLPKYLAPTRTLPPGVQDNNGAELQYLAQFQPYSYGLSPIALGYNYQKRAQVLARVGRQKHLQLSDMVVDNQPALTLRAWSDEEWERGRRFEQRALGNTAGENVPRELRTSTTAPQSNIVDRIALDQAIFSYDRASKVAAAAVPEFLGHIHLYPSGIQNYASHVDNAKAIVHLTAADAWYLQAIAAATPEERKALLGQAKAEYLQAQRWFDALVLAYYVDDPDAAAVGYTRAKVPGMNLDQLQALMVKWNQRVQSVYKGLDRSPHGEDLKEYNDNLRRIADRLNLIK
jgi:hypothetical protein